MNSRSLVHSLRCLRGKSHFAELRRRWIVHIYRMHEWILSDGRSLHDNEDAEGEENECSCCNIRNGVKSTEGLHYRNKREKSCELEVAHCLFSNFTNAKRKVTFS